MSSSDVPRAVGEDESTDTLPPLERIWDCPKIRLIGVCGSEDEAWVCDHCGNLFKKHNPTKCLSHVSRLGTKKNNIRGCQGRIKQPYLERYIALYNQKLERKRQRKAARRLHNSTISERQYHTTHALTSSRKKSKSCSVSDSVAAVDIMVDT